MKPRTVKLPPAFAQTARASRQDASNAWPGVEKEGPPAAVPMLLELAERREKQVAVLDDQAARLRAFIDRLLGAMPEPGQCSEQQLSCQGMLARHVDLTDDMDTRLADLEHQLSRLSRVA